MTYATQGSPVQPSTSLSRTTSGPSLPHAPAPQAGASLKGRKVAAAEGEHTGKVPSHAATRTHDHNDASASSSPSQDKAPLYWHEITPPPSLAMDSSAQGIRVASLQPFTVREPQVTPPFGSTQALRASVLERRSQDFAELDSAVVGEMKGKEGALLPPRRVEVMDVIRHEALGKGGTITSRQIRTLVKFWCDEGKDTPVGVVGRTVESAIKHSGAFAPAAIDTVLAIACERLGGVDMREDRLLKITSTLAKACAFVPDDTLARVAKALAAGCKGREWPAPQVAAVHRQLETLTMAPFYKALICQSLGMPVPQ